MSGHNKFSKIKHKKEAEDAKKSKAFSVLAKQIAIESRAAKGDRNSAGLRLAIEKARAANMPKENIDRAVDKGAGVGGNAMEDFLCEAYGPGGVAIIIKGTTDSKNRTINEIKFTLSENGGTLGAQGSVVWAFQGTGGKFQPITKVPLSPEDKEMLEIMTEELEANPDVDEIYTNLE